MKPTILIFLVLIGCRALFSQTMLPSDTAPPTDPAKQVPIPPPVQLSPVPTSQEIADLFVAANANFTIDDAVRLVAKKGDGAVPALEQLIFSRTIVGSKRIEGDTSNGTITFAPRKIHALFVLESICTPSAVAVLLRIVREYDDATLRGYALNAINRTYYQQVRKQNIAPDKAVVAELFRCANDQFYVAALQKTISQIAKEGIFLWLGVDFGDPQFQEERIKAGMDGKELNSDDYRKVWWDAKSQVLTWNGNVGRFEASR